MPEQITQPAAAPTQAVATEVSTAVPQAQSVAPAAAVEATQADDLLKRVAAFKPSEAQPPSTEVPLSDIKLDDIKDPTARAIVEKKNKDLERGFTKKFEELANIRKQYEARQTEDANWTPERIQKLLNDPTFVQAAQTVAGVQPGTKQAGLSDTEWSALSETEKAKINEMQNQLRNIQQMHLQSVKAQEDAQLKAKYATYNSQAVDIITNDLLQGRVNATREHLFKVLDYENAVQRAYELGRQDAKAKTEEKVNSMSYVGNTGTQVSSSGIAPEKGESNSSFWNKIVMKNLSLVAGKK